MSNKPLYLDPVNLARPEVIHDTTAADIWGRYLIAQTRLVNARRGLRLELDRNGNNPDGYYAEQYAAEVAKAEPIAQALSAEFVEHEKSYGGWARFYIVKNPGGHIHSSQHCSTCNNGEHATEFAFLPYLSALSDDDAINGEGPVLCSVCFPDAPVEHTNGVPRWQEEAKAARDNEKAVRKLPGFKPWERKRDLVARKDRAISDYVEAQKHVAEDEAADREPMRMFAEKAAKAEAELPKLQNQWERARAALADLDLALRVEIMNAGLEPLDIMNDDTEEAA